MGHSVLLGADRAAAEPLGRDIAALGPSDSSDSGADMAGIDEFDDGLDPAVPVDVAMRDDMPHGRFAPEGMDGSAASDAGGTGERRSAGADAGLPEGSDIGVDRVFTPGLEADDEELLFVRDEEGLDEEAQELDAVDDAMDDDDLSDDEDPDLAFTDEDEDDGLPVGRAHHRPASTRQNAELDLKPPPLEDDPVDLRADDGDDSDDEAASDVPLPSPQDLLEAQEYRRRTAALLRRH